MNRRNLVISVLAVSLSLTGYSQEEAKIKHAPPSNTDPASGVEMYRTYCAVCHGLDGKGSGPAAPALKQKLPDLTLLSKKNGGEFPTFRVSNIIQGDAVITAHGSKAMPMWGDVFRVLKRDEAIVKLRVHNLTQYIASLQP
ncbi:MAG: c-type cytochrome [Bryobacteraceae bacterium]|jgi:mono/diheme cytochrome c family protein